MRQEKRRRFRPDGAIADGQDGLPSCLGCREFGK
jgi:hypothetical protein